MARPLITIAIDETGVTEVGSQPRSVAEANQCTRLLNLLSLPIRLMDDTIKEANVRSAGSVHLD